MTFEEIAAQQWFLNLSNDEMKEVMLEAYQNHLKKIEERKALGFKFGIGE